MEISLDFIKQIETGGESDPVKAYNKVSQARGLYQITPIVLKEWNNYNKSEKYGENDLFKSAVNEKIADWYLHKRIPLTLENVLISYNAGIDYVVSRRSLPEETVNYINSYKKLSKNEGIDIVKKALAIAKGIKTK